MVYETDFYTTRRPYSRPNISSYSVTRRQVPWEMVPDVPRPSQVPPAFTAFGKMGKYGDDSRRHQPRTAAHSSLSSGVISVYPRRFPNPPLSGAPISTAPIISRKYAPRRVRIADEIRTQEMVDQIESAVRPVTEATTMYTTNYKGPITYYSTYYHA